MQTLKINLLQQLSVLRDSHSPEKGSASSLPQSPFSLR